MTLPAAAGYEYDDEGNRTVRFVDEDSSGTFSYGDTDVTSYTWDHRNRLTRVAQHDDFDDYSGGSCSEEILYEYDYADRLIRREHDPDGDDGSTSVEQSVYVYDGQHILLQLDDAGGDDLTETDLSHRYLHGPAIDMVLADEQVHWNTDDYVTDKLYWALTDNLGSVRDLAEYNSGTDTTTIANHRVYDAFGNITSETTPAVDHLFAYTGRIYDEDTGLQNNRRRWYDATTGLWLSEDPIDFSGGDVNLARYVWNAPTYYVDPLGTLLAQPPGNYGGSGRAGRVPQGYQPGPRLQQPDPHPLIWPDHFPRTWNWDRDYLPPRPWTVGGFPFCSEDRVPQEIRELFESIMNAPSPFDPNNPPPPGHPGTAKLMDKAMEGNPDWEEMARPFGFDHQDIENMKTVKGLPLGPRSFLTEEDDMLMWGMFHPKDPPLPGYEDPRSPRYDDGRR